jgi:hypothetical protein
VKDLSELKRPPKHELSEEAKRILANQQKNSKNRIGFGIRRRRIGGGALNASARAFINSGLIDQYPEHAAQLHQWVNSPEFYWNPAHPLAIMPSRSSRGFPFFLDQRWYGEGEAWKTGLNVALQAGKAAAQVAEGVLNDDPGKAAQGALNEVNVVRSAANGGRIRGGGVLLQPDDKKAKALEKVDLDYRYDLREALNVR